jgi:hypothetical protein
MLILHFRLQEIIKVEDTLQNHRCENLKSYNNKSCLYFKDSSPYTNCQIYAAAILGQSNLLKRLNE